MILVIALLFFQNPVDCRSISQLKSNNAIMYKVIGEFIPDSSTGTHLYFCRKKDATTVLKHFADSHIISSRILNSTTSAKEITTSFSQPQVMKIFLDLTCHSGIKFLEQSSQLFNCSYRWLIWTNDYNQSIDLLNTARILVDSTVIVAVMGEDEIVLYDLYKMHYSTPFTITKVKIWSAAGTSMKLAEPKPRNNFMGTVIKSSVVARFLNYSLDNIIELMLDPSYMPGVDAKRRFHLQMFLYLAEHYNFTPSYKYARTWGIPTKNGSYTGMIGQIHRNETEISAVYTIFSVPRSAVIDYVLAVTWAKGSILFLQPQLLGTYKALIVPLEPTVWVAVVVTSIITIVSFKIVGRYDALWSDSMVIVVATISQQGGPDMENLAKKLWHLAVLNFSFFITLYYNIAILSGLLLPAPNAIQNMDQLLASNLKFGVETEPYIRNDFESDDDVSVRLRAKIAKSKLFNKVYFGSDDGLELIRRGDFAFYNLVTDSYTKIRDTYTESEVCSLSEIDKFSNTHIGPIVQNNGPYKEIFRRSILLMKENGMIKYQYKFWVASKPECHWKQEKFTIGARALTLAFGILLIGLFASLIIFLIEVRKFRKNQQQVDLRQSIFDTKELSLFKKSNYHS